MKKSYAQISLGSALLGCWLFFGCSNWKVEESNSVPICELRAKPQKFIGKTISVGGWVYTDVHHYLVEQGSCSVAIEGGTLKTSDSKDSELLRFRRLVFEAQRGSWNTQGELFVIVEGEFQTVEELSWGMRLMSWLGLPDQGTPGKIILNRYVCSTTAPLQMFTMEQATSKCYREQSGGAP